MEASIPYERSFASHEKSQFWSSLNGTIKPRDIFKSSNTKYWFDCDICHHQFQTALHNISRGGWCPYCSNPPKKICDNIDCNSCYEKSFASHEKNPYWSSQNGTITPRNVFKSSTNTYWFNCDKCPHSFQSNLNNITSTTGKGRWCPYCSKKQLCNKNDCSYCYEKSFASHEKSQYWSQQNGTIMPRNVFKSSNTKCWFDCDKCNHSFYSELFSITSADSWCPYCSNIRLCENDDCTTCYEKSFASNEKEQYWSLNNGDIIPRKVFKRSNNKYWFDCDKCQHSFQSSANSITIGSWCSFCSKPPKQMCENDCPTCYEKSFASHEKSRFWSTNNGTITPRQVFKCSNNKYWFDCDKCHHPFYSALNCITNGTWCPICKNKTEGKLFTTLLPRYETIVTQFKMDWCKHMKHLPFDFCITDYKILIELDGPQHFRQVSNWQCPEKTFEIDKYKETCANENGYSVIRIIQQDVWNDSYEWCKELCNTIEEIKTGNEIVNIYLCKNDEYHLF